MKGNKYRLDVTDLLAVVEELDGQLRTNIFLAACGGTALTLYGHKESTKDVDFLVPDPKHYQQLIRLLENMGYKPTSQGFAHPNGDWIFDLFRGQTIFQTELLDPVQQEGKHRIIQKYNHVVVACLNPDDLIISKMFRGTSVDVDDSIIMIESENMDLKALAERYKETAGYYYNPIECKKNLGYLITGIEKKQIDATPLKEMSEQWMP